MSSYKYWWRPCAELALRQVPRLIAECTPSESNTRPCHLSWQEKLILFAVDAATERFSKSSDGKTALQIVRIVDFGSGQVQSAADALGISLKSAIIARSAFIDAFGHFLGY